MLRICAEQVSTKKHVPDHADCTAPTLQHELDPTHDTHHTDQECICCTLKDLVHQVETDDLSDVCIS